MDSSSVVSDDDYDVISNPGHRSLESSLDDFSHEVREFPASEEALDKFETTRWNDSEVQAFIRRGLSSDKHIQHRRVRVYVDGPFDQFHVGHALQLRQAKLAFPAVHLIVGVFSDEVLSQNNSKSLWPEVERLELVRHCRWVDEVVKDAPWELTDEFTRKRHIDFVAINEGTSVDPQCDKTRVKGYDELKTHGKIIITKRTLGLVSQHRSLITSPSQRATPTIDSPSTPYSAPHVDSCGLGY